MRYEDKAVLICTNIPDGNSPMILSYINYLLSDLQAVIFTSKISNLKLPSDVQTLTTHYLSYKYHLILYPFVVSYMMVILPMSYFANWTQAKKNFSFSNFIKDILASTKYYVNHIAINLFHFYNMMKYRPKFVVCICAGSTLAARWYKALSKTNFSYSLYEIYPNQLPEDFYFRKRIKAAIEKKGCEKASTIFIPYSDQFMRLIKLRYGIKDEHKFVKMVSLPKEVEKPMLLDSALPVKLYYHGSFDDQRGLDVMIKAIKNFDSSKVVLFLRGFGPLESTLKHLVVQEKLKDQVTFLPPLPPDQLASSARAFDVGLSLVRGRTANNRFLIGFKALDYICAGIASFVPNNYVLGKMIKSKEIGVVYDRLDVESLTQAIVILINSSSLTKYKENTIDFASERINFQSQRSTFLGRINFDIKN